MVRHIIWFSIAFVDLISCVVMELVERLVFYEQVNMIKKLKSQVCLCLYRSSSVTTHTFIWVSYKLLCNM